MLQERFFARFLAAGILCWTLSPARGAPPPPTIHGLWDTKTDIEWRLTASVDKYVSVALADIPDELFFTGITEFSQPTSFTTHMECRQATSYTSAIDGFDLSFGLFERQR